MTGDVITVTASIGDTFEKQGRPGGGLMVFTRYDNTYRNQRSEIVAICRWKSVGYEGPTNGEQAPNAPSSAASTPPDPSHVPSPDEREAQRRKREYLEDVSEGLELAPVAMLQTQKRFVRWARASNDLSDIHYDYKLMRGRVMPDVVGQGTLSAGYVVRAGASGQITLTM